MSEKEVGADELSECERFDHDYEITGEDEDGFLIFVCDACGAEWWEEGL